MYDNYEISRRVNQKRKRFLLMITVIACLLIAASILIIINVNNTLTFISIVTVLVLLLATYRIFDTQSPMVLFSKEIKGINIREDEYVTRKAPGPGLQWRQVGGPASPQPFAPNTGANRRRTPPNIRSRVYLQLEDGNIVTISSLYKSHTELFVEGDTLLKYAGTQFPIVVSRDMPKQPCPICGEVNDMSADSCKSCGLGIVKP